jgi:hypothetical protein
LQDRRHSSAFALLVRRPPSTTQTEPPTPPARQNDPTPRSRGPQNFLNQLAAHWRQTQAPRPMASKSDRSESPPSPVRVSAATTPLPDRPRRSSDGKGRVAELPAERVARLRDLLFVAGGLEPDALKRVSTTTSSDDSDDEVFVKPRKRRLER